MEGWRERVERLARIGVLPTDSRDEALRKETLVLFASFTTLLSFMWVGTYWALGLYLSAAIPFAYQVVSVANLAVFAKTKRYRFFRTSALSLGLALPFFLQLSLGGFITSSGIVLWSFTAPLGALLFSSRQDATRWFAAFLGIIALSAALDPWLTPGDIPHGIVIAFFALNILGVTGTSDFLLHYFVRERDRAAAAIAAERQRSDRLLLNVLPEPIAERLKSGESPIADRASEVGVLFADIVGFTRLSETMRPEELVSSWTRCSPSSMVSSRNTGWRRSRRSEMPTWLPLACSAEAPATASTWPRWRSRCRRRSGARRRSKFGSEWTSGLSSQA